LPKKMKKIKEIKFDISIPYKFNEPEILSDRYSLVYNFNGTT